MDCCICNIFGKLFGRKKKKDKEKGDAEPTRKKETKLIDFD